MIRKGRKWNIQNYGNKKAKNRCIREVKQLKYHKNAFISDSRGAVGTTHSYIYTDELSYHKIQLI